MRTITHYEAEDGSLWTSEEAATNHERRLRGERVSDPEIAYLVATVDGDWRAYKKVGGGGGVNAGNYSISRLPTSYDRTIEAADAFTAILRDIGYEVPVFIIDGPEWFDRFSEPFFPKPGHFVRGKDTP